MRERLRLGPPSRLVKCNRLRNGDRRIVPTCGGCEPCIFIPTRHFPDVRLGQFRPNDLSESLPLIPKERKYNRHGGTSHLCQQPTSDGLAMPNSLCATS